MERVVLTTYILLQRDAQPLFRSAIPSTEHASINSLVALHTCTHYLTVAVFCAVFLDVVLSLPLSPGQALMISFISIVVVHMSILPNAMAHTCFDWMSVR